MQRGLINTLYTVAKAFTDAVLSLPTGAVAGTSVNGRVAGVRSSVNADVTTAVTKRKTDSSAIVF
jgi:hypothetical protein